MRLNPDCIRDILLTVEQECDGHSLIYISDGSDLSQKEFLCKYKIDEVLYHINQCNLSGFFTKCVLDLSGGYKIIDLSPKGHEFLADVRKQFVMVQSKKYRRKNRCWFVESSCSNCINNYCKFD